MIYYKEQVKEYKELYKGVCVDGGREGEGQTDRQREFLK